MSTTEPSDAVHMTRVGMKKPALHDTQQGQGKQQEDGVQGFE